MTARQIWYDGRFYDEGSIRRGLMEQGLHYGTGVFEGIRAYRTKHGPAIFRLGEHMDRMQKGADLLEMPMDRNAMQAAMFELLWRNNLSDAYIRPICFYGGGKLHLDVHDLLLRQAVATLPWTSHLGDEAEDTGVRMSASTMRKNSARAIPALKLCGAYINAILAKLQATKKGFDEALFLDADGLVVEASAENVFIVKDGRVIANEHEDALPGITRDAIATIAGAERRPIHINELLDADEVFLTGTSAEVAPVTALDDRTWEIGPITRQLQATYQDVVHGRDLGFSHWLTWTEPARVAAK